MASLSAAKNTVDTLVVGQVSELTQQVFSGDEGAALRVQTLADNDLDAFCRRLDERAWDVVVAEVPVAGLDAAELVRRAKKIRPGCPIVMIASVEHLGQVLQARQEGLDEYVVRAPQAEVTVGLLADALERALSHPLVEQLSRFEQNFWVFFEAAPIGMDILDLDGTILSANPALAEFLGYTAEELQGRKFTDFTVSDESQEARDLVRELVGGPPTDYAHVAKDRQSYFVVDRRYRRKDGSVCVASLVRLLFCDEDGSSRFIVGMIVDITGRVRAEEALGESEARRREMERRLRQAEKMEALGQLAGGIAHDFNNVLSIVNSYADLLATDVGETSPLMPYIDKIGSAVWRGSRLTRQLLAFSPEKYGEAELIDINRVVREMESFFGRALDANITIELDLANDLAKVEADPGQIEQILMNLVVNARDAMPEGGRLDVRTLTDTFDNEERAPGALRPGRYAVMQVEDTGVGMDEETRARIFEPFYTTKREGKGTGLGLATVYGIVHRYDGFIEVESEQGQGSCFTIYLPGSEQDEFIEQIEEQVEEHTEGQGHETLLLVEDERDIREPLRRTLENGGYTVLEAADGEEAIEVAKEHPGPIDLLVSDVILPGISGVDVADQLTDIQPDLKAIFISGYTGDVLEQKNLHPGRVLISKPFAIEELLHTVREVLLG